MANRKEFGKTISLILILIRNIIVVFDMYIVYIDTKPDNKIKSTFY